jgi:branched-chain amino acid transport system substrate-binding protein
MPSVIQEAQLAVDELNAKGGILGRKVQLEIVDDQSGADGALKAFNAAIYDKKVNVIIAMETSAARNAGQPIALKANMPFIYTSNYEGHACGTNLYINAPVPVQVVKPMVTYFTDSFHSKKWYLIGSDYAYGRGELADFKSYIQQAGGTVIGEDYNPIDAADWTAIFAKVRNSNADAVATATAGGAPNVSFLKQWKASGLTQPIASLSIDEGTAVAIGGAAEGVYYPSNYFTAVPDSKNQAFLSSLKSRFGADFKTPNFLSVPEYYGVLLYALAAEKAKTLDSSAVLKALPDVSADGPSGIVQMNVQHHAALNIWIGQVLSDGNTKVLKNLGQIAPGEQCPNLA